MKTRTIRLDSLFNCETKSLALIILNNSSINVSNRFNLFQNLWNNSVVRVCADGGAQVLYNSKENLIPDAICGDFDSLDSKILEDYQKKGVKIVQDEDQDSTDLQKCLNYLTRTRDRGLNVVIFGAFGGRLDHQMAHINTALIWYILIYYLILRENRFRDIYLLNHETVGVVLQKGANEIINSKDHQDYKTAGIIPIGAPCENLSLDGFRWNLDSAKSAFGGLVSTSNEIVLDAVMVENSEPVFFCTSLC
eukprot:snap_masked-scaffold_12-processed-gene-8.31-mRNA-1 protein AED:0.08 eAED:1.00 QI:0/-1/0/1/-1/1/1/0/249